MTVQQLVMVNYACGFTQSETGKYFEWIIIIIIIITIIIIIIKNVDIDVEVAEGAIKSDYWCVSLLHIYLFISLLLLLFFFVF